MAKLPIIPNRSYILDTINQIEVFAKYISKYTEVKLTVDDILYLVKKNYKMNSPFREDYDPSVGFKYNGIVSGKDISTDFHTHGRLKMRDFVASKPRINSIFWGDCFDLVGYIIGKDPHRPTDFNDILTHIYYIFHEDEATDEIHKILKQAVLTRSRTCIDINIREWNNHDAKYWNQYHIPIDFIKDQKVYPINYYWLNGELTLYEYRPNDPCYAYYSGVDKNGNTLFQLYFPYRNKNRFISNHNGIIDPFNITNSDTVVLSKSRKDTILLQFCIPHIYRDTQPTIYTLHSENTYIREVVGEYLMKTYPKRYIYCDYDYVGICSMNHHKREYGFKPLYLIPTSPDVKDISDYSKKHGLNKLIELLKQIEL
jgi:hypothetical protein